MYIVKKKDGLIDFFKSVGISKNKIKTYVKLGFVSVNGNIVTKLPYFVEVGDVVDINKREVVDSSFNIVYEDSNYLVVDKVAGLLTISTASSEKNIEDTLYRRVRNYLNKKGEYAFIVNRIDKETSGLVIFAKSQELKDRLQENWNNIVKKRGYIAVVSGRITKNGRIENYLYEDKKTFTHSTKIGGKLAISSQVVH